jgi:RNA polymerase sigma-70 factor (ECF subfamily)
MAANAEIVSAVSAGLCTGPALAYAPAMVHEPDDSALMLRYQDGDVTAFEVLYRRHKDPTAKFTTFLYRVAHNCFIDHVRRNKRHAGNTTLEPELHGDPGETLELTTERSLARERLELALQTLPDEQRDAFLLSEEGGLSMDQIASVTGCNRETAKSRVRYAINKLRSAIDEPAESS